MVQGTQVQGQDRQRGATLLLGIEGLDVAAVALEQGGDRVVDVVTNHESAAGCPECGVLSTSVKGHAITQPRDLPYGPHPVRLVWRKRRWRCTETVCERGSFTEAIPRSRLERG